MPRPRADQLTQARALAETDELTGLPNRRSWEARIREAVTEATLGRKKLCVALVDLDYFKEFNERYGHQTGDRFLKTAASGWRSALRQGDTLARYGGEEFGVVLPSCALDEARGVLERLRALIPRGLTCSIGLAQWSPGESDVEIVLRADQALYEAKGSGRDTLVAAA